MITQENSFSKLPSKAVDVICKIFNVAESEIYNITLLKKGMTNNSYSFNINENKYLIRIPGKGTAKMINRHNEFEIYQRIKKYNISDEIVYINPINGYKITKFLKKVRTCDKFNENDLKKCMTQLKKFHKLELKVNNHFDLFNQINYYEKLWNGKKSYYEDYYKTKKGIFELKEIIDMYKQTEVLTHIDAIPDNFLIYEEGNEEKVKLIDWEYAGMQDPHVDIAMFAIYSMYSKNQIDNLIDIYFESNCSKKERIKIYCYIAVCGLLWSNWCEYKKNLGQEFGTYSLKQYEYAKKFYKIVKEEMNDCVQGKKSYYYGSRKGN